MRTHNDGLHVPFEESPEWLKEVSVNTSPEVSFRTAQILLRLPDLYQGAPCNFNYEIIIHKENLCGIHEKQFAHLPFTLY